MLNEPFLGVTPETFQSVDVYLSVGEPFLMVDLQVPVSATHQSVIASEFISIDNRTSSYCLEGQLQQSLCPDVLDDFDTHNAISFENTEYRHFIGSPSASFSFSSATEVGFIQFDLSAEQIPTLNTMGQDGHSNRIDCFKDRWIAQSNLLRDLSCRQLQLIELNDPQPLSTTDSQPANPPSSKIMKGIFASLTSESFSGNSVDFVAVTSTAETTVLFPT
jgi:hypothetical protein